MPGEPWSMAVYGATGALGRQVLIGIEGQGIDVDQLTAIAAERTAGQEVPWGGRGRSAIGVGKADPGSYDVAILATPRAAAAELLGDLTQRGVLIVDASGAGVAEGVLPLVWPGFNEEAIETLDRGFGIPGAEASTIAPVLAALSAGGPIVSVDAVALVSAAHVGRAGEGALSSQTFALLDFRLPDPGALGEVVAFNAAPGSAFAASDDEPLERRLRVELPALVPAAADARIDLSVVRVPLFAGLGISLSVRFAEPPDLEAVERALGAAGDLEVRDEGPAVRVAIDVDEVLVGQLRHDAEGGIRCFIAADPLHRTGQAVGALLARVQEEELW